jgi:hypothetical protein
MARVAPRVYASAADIARLEALACQLLQDERVEVVLEDGTTLRGVVEYQPSVQMFFDPQGREGSNAQVRLDLALDDAGRAAGVRDLWLDDIRGVTHLANPSPPEATTRTSPPDPNAPTIG